MKAKGGGAGPAVEVAASVAMEAETGAAAAAAALARVCRNCKRSVASHNFSLHEAHCLRFLAVCPQCEEPVALKEMEQHLAGAHQQVRCQLCHQAMQQYQLEHHKAEQCPERPGTCGFCELPLPFRQLEAHLDTCGSRTTTCWDCGKYVMYRALEGHRQVCGSSPGGLSPEPKGTFCQQCQTWVPEEHHLQHLDQCCPLPQLLGALSTDSSPGPGSPPSSSPQSPPGENGTRPKKKDKDLSSVLGRPSLKPPRSKRTLGWPAFTPTMPPPLTSQDNEENSHNASAYDQLAACPQCSILLPSPTLQKHQKKCQRRALSLQGQQWRRRSPRLLGKGEESQTQTPSGENSCQ